MMFTT